MHELHIKHLSKSQMSRLMNGHTVTVHHGNGHKLMVHGETHKRIRSAFSKGRGARLEMDRELVEHNRHLRGEGFLDTLKNIGSTIGSVASKAVSNPIVNKIGDKLLTKAIDVGLSHMAGGGLNGVGLEGNGRHHVRGRGLIHSDMVPVPSATSGGALYAAGYSGGGKKRKGGKGKGFLGTLGSLADEFI